MALILSSQMTAGECTPLYLKLPNFNISPVTSTTPHNLHSPSRTHLRNHAGLQSHHLQVSRPNPQVILRHSQRGSLQGTTCVACNYDGSRSTSEGRTPNLILYNTLQSLMPPRFCYSIFLGKSVMRRRDECAYGGVKCPPCTGALILMAEDRNEWEVDTDWQGVDPFDEIKSQVECAAIIRGTPLNRCIQLLWMTEALWG